MYWENLNLYCTTITHATNESIILDTAHCCILLKHVSEISSVCEESSPLGCNTRLHDAQFQCLHARVKPTKKKLPDPENEGIIILQNARNHLPNNMVSHSQRLESAATLTTKNLPWIYFHYQTDKTKETAHPVLATVQWPASQQDVSYMSN